MIELDQTEQFYVSNVGSPQSHLRLDRAVVEERPRISQSLSSTLCNLNLLMNRSLQVQTPRTGANADNNHHLKHPLLQQGHS